MTDGAHLPVGELLAETERALSQVVTLGPSAARWLVAECCGLEDDELAGAMDRPVTVGAVTRVRDGVRRLSEGEPLQYVLGHWQFRSLDLMVDRRVLIPRPETEQLVELTLAWIAERGEGPVRVVDLGTGSGAIGLSIAAECPTAEVTLTDASSAALEVARANLTGLGRAASRVRILEGDWFDAVAGEERGHYDVIVSNPPYVADDEVVDDTVAQWEPVSALRSGPDGLDDIAQIAAEAARYATHDALLAIECATSHAAAAASLVGAGGWDAIVEPDLTGRSRFVVGRRRIPPTDGT